MAFKLPFITSSIPKDLRAFCDRVRELLTGTGPDRIVTRRDLIATGVVTEGPAGTLLPPPPENKFGSPPLPSGLVASGAIANIILTWDAPNYAGHAYTEIYFADTNTFADRVKLADAPGSVFSHSVGAATTKYYWIRFVNANGVASQFNSTNGVAGTTGQNPDYLMDVLSDAFGSTSLAPFFQIDVPTTINGVLIPAGTYIKQAFIADATISRAKIQDLAVDNAKINDLNAVKINAGFLSADRIQAGSIDANKLSFTVVGTSNVVGTINASTEGIRISGTKIQIDGNVTFSAGYDPTTKIASGGAATDINNNVTTISGGKITTGSIAADKINVTDLTVENLKTSASGQRIEITKSINEVRAFNSAGTQIARFGGSGNGFINATTSAANTSAIWGTGSGGSNFGVYGEATTSNTNGAGVWGNSSAGMGVYGFSTGFDGVRGQSSTGIGVFGRSISHIGVGAEAQSGSTEVALLAASTSSQSTSHAIRGSQLNASYLTSGIVGPARNDCDFFAESRGVYLPFTGAHEGLIFKSEIIEIGDILVDGQVMFKKSVSDVATEMFKSTAQNQKSAIGILQTTQEISETVFLAAAIIDFDVTQQEEKDGSMSTRNIKTVVDPRLYDLADTHFICTVNAVGEGQINVCGEGGDIEAGDLIVTSSIPGKGMKQSDDIVRAITVAKARESVTFSSPTEVKQIACIYLCG